MKKIKNAFPLVVIALVVGLYQINLLENTLNSNGIENHLSEELPWGSYAQSWVENNKIEMMAYLTKQEKSQSIGEPIKSIEVAQIKPISSAPLKVAVNTTSSTATQQSLSKQPTKEIHVASIEINGKDSSSPTSKSNGLTPVNSPNDNKTKCVDNCIVLALGDSVMGDIYYSLSRQLRKTHPTWKVIDAHKVSSGLSNQTYYDWPQIAQKLSEQYKPNYTVLLLGTNDAQGIISDKHAYAFGKDSWKEIYSQRAQTLAQIISSSQDGAYWIELPQVRDSGFNSRLNIIREIHQENAKSFFVSTQELLGNSKDPHFSQYRQNDGIHLNAQGSDKIAQKLVELMTQ